MLNASEAIIEIVRHEMTMQGIKPYELGKKVGCSGRIITYWLNGERGNRNCITVGLADKVLNELGVSYTLQCRRFKKIEGTEIMTAKNAQVRASMRYDARNTVKFTVKLNRRTDRDLIERMESVSNKNGYIKELIRKDIEDGKDNN